MAKHYITIEDDLYEDIANYCKLNNLKINSYCCNLLRNEHNINKYGDIPFGVIGNSEKAKSLDLHANESSFIFECNTAHNTNEHVNNTVEDVVSEIENEQEIPTEEIIKPKKRRL